MRLSPPPKPPSPRSSAFLLVPPFMLMPVQGSSSTALWIHSWLGLGQTGPLSLVPSHCDPILHRVPFPGPCPLQEGAFLRASLMFLSLHTAQSYPPVTFGLCACSDFHTFVPPSVGNSTRQNPCLLDPHKLSSISSAAALGGTRCPGPPGLEFCLSDAWNRPVPC